MKKKILGWLDQREKMHTLAIANEQMRKALDTVYQLEKSVKEASQGDRENSLRSISNLFEMEEEVDRLRREVFCHLASVEMRTRDREDILHLVKRLDGMADHVKDAARAVLLLSESKSIPTKVWDNLIQISKNLVQCASALRMSIEKLKDDTKEAQRFAREVDEWEHKVDEQNLDSKRLLITESRRIDPAVLVILRDLLLSMEEVADSCADTADYICVLIEGGLTEY